LTPLSNGLSDKTMRIAKKLAVLGVICFLGACGKKDSFSPDDNAGVQLANRVSIFESKDNQQQWLLTAEAVDFADMTSATLKNPQLLLKQNGQDSARVSGHTGTFDYNKKLITIEGDAQIHSLTEQTLITTERFFYDVDKDKVWSDRKTTITRGTAKSVARGGIETDSKLKKIVLKNHATRVPQNARELKK